MQPTYLPWLGFYEMINRCDAFVFLDNVQYAHQSWQSRNRLKGTNGSPVWLVVPVKREGLDTLIRDVQIASQPSNWKRKHLQTITTLLGKTPYFKRFRPALEAWYATEHTSLASLNESGIKMVSEWLDLETEFLSATQLKPTGKRTELILDICRKTEATDYYSPIGAASYLDPEKHLLTGAGINVHYQTWEHPEYEQRFGQFLSHMSALDAVMNIGPEATRELLLA
ncbi:WbqC family protein [Salidesulfovibrio brasiliensis]